MINQIQCGGREYIDTYIPHELVESYSGVRAIDLRTKELNDRCISISGAIDMDMANNFGLQFRYIVRKDAEQNNAVTETIGEKRPITIYINSPGGHVDAGLVIYDMIQAYDGPIDMYCVGMAASMGAIIFASGQKGRRYILPHSKVMIHEPLISGGVGGSATSIKQTADSILATKAELAEILVKHTGKSPEEVEKAISFDNYMSAKEAIEFGICDEIKNVF